MEERKTIRVSDQSAANFIDSGALLTDLVAGAVAAIEKYGANTTFSITSGDGYHEVELEYDRLENDFEYNRRVSREADMTAKKVAQETAWAKLTSAELLAVNAPYTVTQKKLKEELEGVFPHGNTKAQQ